ncbi:MAG: ParB N-terminal domain-containing protein [Oscillospiraceae bacterium]|nr:ParB N-terminal domain-containing protein [Oscillospiraceae bacterium]
MREMFYDDNNELISAEYELWDFDENTQERIKKAMREIGFDKIIDMDKAFIPREEEPYVELNLGEMFGLNTNNEAPAPKNIFFSNQISSKAEPAKHANINDLIIDSKVKYDYKIKQIHISKLVDINESINFFPLPNNEEFLDLMESLETYGVINPFLVIKNGETDQYTVVSGRSRLAALNHLYNANLDEIYSHAPCIVLDPSTNSSIIQGIVIATNLNYKKVSKDVQIKAILLLDEILTKNKAHRSQINITNTIADKAGISRTTANTIRGFKNLSEKALDLLYKDHLTRGAARILSMIKDKNTQDMIIEKLGNHINDIPKLQEMLVPPNRKVYDKNTNTMVPDTWEKKTERALDKAPRSTTIILHVDSKEVEGILKALIPLRAKAVSKYQTFKEGEINKYFKVILNDSHMEQFIKKGYVTQVTLDLVRSSDYKEVIKHSQGY